MKFIKWLFGINDAANREAHNATQAHIEQVRDRIINAYHTIDSCRTIKELSLFAETDYDMLCRECKHYGFLYHELWRIAAQIGIKAAQLSK